MMKRVILVVFLFISICQLASSQLWTFRRYEVYGALGTTQFFGDIGGFTPGENGVGFKDIIISQTRFSASTGMRYRIIENVSVKAGFSFGLIHASDEKGSNVIRGMEATTAIFEPAITGEYFFLKNKTGSNYRYFKGKKFFSSLISGFDGYVYAGVAPLFYSVTPNEVLLPALQKEGGVAVVFPIGLGFNYLFSPNLMVGVDMGIRYTTSDYLDGYTSQYSNSNDVYYFMTFVFTHKLKTSEKGLPSFRK